MGRHRGGAPRHRQGRLREGGARAPDGSARPSFQAEVSPLGTHARMKITLGIAAAFLVALATSAPAPAADYAGPLIDAHSHVPNATAVDAYVEAMKRHDVRRVLLLGVGGTQKDDPAWIAAAARKYPDRILRGVPVPDPLAADAGARLEAALGRGKANAIGEVHLRQVSR